MFTLDEALSAIKNKPEFKHICKGGYSVIDYLISTRNTFDGNSSAETTILKNLRGTCFNSDGEISRLGFEKFHNFGECQGYFEGDIDFNQPHHVLEKLDGSCIFQISMFNSYRLGTRAGITDYSDMAEEYIASSLLKSQYETLITYCTNNNKTAIFEFTSRKNKVVIDYPEDALTLLAVRSIETGEYVPRKSLEQFISKYTPGIPLVKVISSDHSTLKELSNYVKLWDLNSEGVVITFEDGFHVKCKSEDYVRKHSCIDQIKFEKSVLKMIIENTIDDVLPLIDESDRSRILKYSESVKISLVKFEDGIDEFFDLYKHLDTKQFAEKVLERPDYKTFLFAKYNLKESILRSFVVRNCGSQTTVDSIRHIVGKSYNEF
jgi:T4 RnlA family RNA ligase